MTNEYREPVCEIRRARADVRATARYMLSQRNCRKLLTVGGLFCAAALALPYLIAMTVISFLPQAYFYDDVSAYTISALVFLITLAGIPFTFSAVYFGMYRVLLHASLGEEPSIENLFAFFASGRSYLRSVRIFFRSFGLIYGMYVFLMITQLVGIITEFISVEYVHGLLWLLTEAVVFIYILFGIVYTAVMRKYKFILIPMLIHRTDLSFSQCCKIAYAAKREVYLEQLRGDLPKCFLWNLLSLCTVGILQIVFVGPDMMAKKVSLYRESVLWPNGDNHDEFNK